MVSDADSARCAKCSMVISSAFPAAVPRCLDTRGGRNMWWRQSCRLDANQLCPVTDIDLIVQILGYAEVDIGPMQDWRRLDDGPGAPSWHIRTVRQANPCCDLRHALPSFLARCVSQRVRRTPVLGSDIKLRRNAEHALSWRLNCWQTIPLAGQSRAQRL